jgi:hypothetical protein
VVEVFQSLAEVVDFELEQSGVLGLEDVLVDGGQFLEADAVGLEGDDLVHLVVQVLQLLPQLPVRQLVLLHQPLLLPVHYHLLLCNLPIVFPSHFNRHPSIPTVGTVAGSDRSLFLGVPLYIRAGG